MFTIVHVSCYFYSTSSLYLVYFYRLVNNYNSVNKVVKLLFNNIIYEGYYNTFVVCHDFCAWCAGAIWNVTSSVWAITSSMWTVKISMHDAHVLCGLLNPLCGLLQPLCMMYRRYVGCYILYVGCYILYV